MRESIESLFHRNFAERGELGASLSVWKDGEEILLAHHGWRDRDQDVPWDSRTMAPVFSATKGPAALTVLLALHNSGVSLHAKVSDIWPELTAAQNGLTYAQLLSHQSGLPALSPDNRSNILNYTATREALERQEPYWEPGKAHGYHPRTIGFLWDEVVRRLTDAPSLGHYWKERIAEKLRVDFYIGQLSIGMIDRLASMYPPRVQRPSEEELPFYREIAKPDSLPAAAFSSPGGMRALSDINKLESLQAGLPALGGVGTAEGLAKFYQVLAQGGEMDHVQVLPKPVVEAARTVLTEGRDLTLQLTTAFTAGFMKDPLEPDGSKHRSIFGPSLSAFGQHGAGGSHSFADPENGISFAYVMNQMETGILPNRKSLDLVEAVYESYT